MGAVVELNWEQILNCMAVYIKQSMCGDVKSDE